MKFEDTPWYGQRAIGETDTVFMIESKYAVTTPSSGHMLFVPKINCAEHLKDCFEAALKAGRAAKEDESNEWSGYNVGINIGETAGQTIRYPHVHLILRTEGDTPNPIGGIRNVIEGKGDYTKQL